MQSGLRCVEAAQSQALKITKTNGVRDLVEPSELFKVSIALCMFSKLVPVQTEFFDIGKKREKAGESLKSMSAG